MLLFTPRPVTIKLLFYRLFTIIFIEVVILEYRPHRLSAEYLSQFAGMIFLTNSGLLLPKYLSEEVFMIYKRKRIVVALGGNALGNTLPEQMIAVKSTAKALCDLIEEGHQVVVVHGNGPQVGWMLPSIRGMPCFAAEARSFSFRAALGRVMFPVKPLCTRA